MKIAEKFFFADDLANDEDTVALIEKTLSGDYKNNEIESVSSVFRKNENLTSVSFAKATSVDSNAFEGCPALIEIHFAAINQSAIEALSGYSSKFGANNATIYFDL